MQGNISITDLPVEILTEIFNHLPHDRHLLQTMLVCHLFRDVLEPIFYRAITLRPPPPHSYLVSYREDSRNGLKILLNTLSFRPQLVRYVKTLSMAVSHALREDCSRLFSLLHSLEDLSLDWVEDGVDDSLDLTNLGLKTLHLRFGEDVDRATNIVGSHFWIPSLDTLHIECLSWEDFEEKLNRDFPSSKYHTSPILNLHLQIDFYNYHNYDGLSKMLLSIKGLKQLSIRFISIVDVIMSDMDQDLSLDLLERMLRPHAPTLEDLIIVPSTWFPYQLNNSENAFTQYSALKRLAIPMSFIRYSNQTKIEQAFPPQLEELQLQYEGNPHESLPISEYDILNTLARSKRTTLRSLRLVVWWNNTNHGDRLPNVGTTPEMMASITAFEEVGVLFRMVEGHFKDTPLGKTVVYSTNGFALDN